MDKREKVIEHIMDYVNAVDGLTNVQWVLAELDILKDALVLLKAQEAVEPIENAGFYYCGACRYAFTSARQKYCSECGRAVKWE